jgi:hypothetical protein
MTTSHPQRTPYGGVRGAISILFGFRYGKLSMHDYTERQNNRHKEIGLPILR